MKIVLTCLTPLFLLLSASLVNGATFIVPLQHPNIQAAIDIAFSGDTILVDKGTYSGVGFRDIDFQGKSIILQSIGGPDVTVIDLQADSTDPHRAFLFGSSEDSLTVIDGFTIRNGYGRIGSAGMPVGGAIYCDSLASPTIRDCIFTSNHASGGGAIYSYYASPLFIDCVIKNSDQPADSGGGICAIRSEIRLVNCELSNLSADIGGSIFGRYSSFGLSSCEVTDNYAATTGGGFYLSSSDLVLDSCHIARNRSVDGGAIRMGTVRASFTTFVDNRAENKGGCFYQSDIELVHCTLFKNYAYNGLFATGSGQISNSIISFNLGGPTIYGHYMQFDCTNMFGNRGGDWEGEYDSQNGIDGNISVDPEFCDTANVDLGLWYTSPCLPENNSCLLMGSMSAGCDGKVLPMAREIWFDNNPEDYAVRSTRPRISWIFFDTIPDEQTAFEIEVGTDPDWLSTDTWSTGIVYLSDSTVRYKGPYLENLTTYYMRLRVKGSGEFGSWVTKRLLVRIPPEYTEESNWPTYQHNAQHTGHNDKDRITIPLELKWSRPSNDYLFPSW